MTPTSTRTTRIRVEIPTRPEQVRVLRLAASSLASDSGLSTERIQDLALAIDELASAVIDAVEDDSCRLLVTLDADDLGIGLRGRVVDGAPSEVLLHDVARSMVDAVCDDWSVSEPGTSASFRLTMLVRDAG